MPEVNEVPTYTPPEGVNGPTLGRDLPDGCERLRASIYPNFRDEWWDGPGVTNDCLYWWRTVPLKVGDTVQLTGTVEWVDEGGGVQRLPVVPPWYLAQDVWMALGGDSNAFDAWAHHEDDRRTWGDAWAQIVAAVEGSRMEGDTNPPPGSILDLPSYQWVREPPAPPWPGDENDDTARLSPDQGDRIVNACCRMLGCEPADIDGDAALEEILTEAVERCADLHGQDRWEDDCHGCGFRVGDHTTDGRCPAPAAPVPPWPGAVLSGLTDEDGVPTWLAQAGQVRGEQVRRRSDLVWVDNDQMVAHLDTVWVEVRAPGAVPEPETERVPWYRAMGRTLPYGELLGDIVQAYPSADSPGGIYVEYELPERNTTGNPHRDDADGTVEVLRRDGDQ